MTGPAAEAGSLPWPAMAPAFERATAGVARLDQALHDAAPALRAAWLETGRLTEATRSAHLDGGGTTEARVALLEADSALGLIEPADRAAHDLLVAARACDRLGPADLLSVAGLAALHGRARRSAIGRPSPSRANCLLFGPPDPPDAGEADDVEDRLALWRDHWSGTAQLPVLPAMALALRAWHEIAPLGADTEVLGRLLVPVLAWERGLTDGPFLMISDRLARLPRPPDPLGPRERWLVGFLTLVADAAEDGRSRLATLGLRRQVWQRRVGPRRCHSRLAAAADVVLARPLVSGRVLVDQLGVSPRGASLLINDLMAAGIIAEVTGRSRFRLFAARG